MRRHLLLPILLFVLLGVATGFADNGLSAVPEGKTITGIELDNPSRVPDKEILRIFQVRVGRPFSAAQAGKSLALLARQVGVLTVILRHRAEGDGIRLKLEVLPEPLVREIEFEGMEVLDDDEIGPRLQTRVDEPVDSYRLEEDAEDIRKRYRQEGYIFATVRTEVLVLEPDWWVEVVFSVEEGEPQRLTHYADMGDADIFGWERVLALLDLRVGDTASSKALQRGVKRLVEACRGADFPEARVEGARIDRGRGEKAVSLHVPLQLGRRTHIVIKTGRDWFPRQLWEVVRARQGEFIDENWLEQVERQMLTVLREQGYRDASIMVEDQLDQAELRTIRFVVEQGPQLHLKKVKFRGNKRIDSDDLEERMQIWEESIFMSPLYRREVVEQDLDALKGYYAIQGMVEAQLRIDKVEVVGSSAVHVRVQVEEGPVYTLEEPVFTCDEGMTPEQAAQLAKLIPGTPASPAAMDAARIRILAELSKRGHIDADVRFSVQINRTAHTVLVLFRVRPEPQLRFGTVVAEGNARTRAEVILRELTFHTGELWNQQEVLISQRRIFRLGYFQDVRIQRTGVPDESGQVDVVVQVREQDAGYVDYGIGYGTEEGVMFFFEVGHTNLWGAGRSLSLRLETEQAEQSYSLNFREPWLLDSPYDLRLSLLYQDLDREAYSLTSTAFQASLDRELTRYVRGSLLYTLEMNRLSNVDDDAVLVNEDDEPYLLSSVGPVLVWDNRDDPFDPHWGYHSDVKAEWALEALGSEVTFGRYTGFASGFFSWRKATLALLGRGGFADTFGAPAELPVNKRFFLGGRSTVRGFVRDAIGPKTDDGTPTGGDVMVNLKAELRFPLYKKLGGTLFWDAGQIWWREEETISLGELRQAVGFGFRYMTPVGPITFDIGFKLDRKSGETPREWHFTIGNVF